MLSLGDIWDAILQSIGAPETITIEKLEKWVEKLDKSPGTPSFAGTAFKKDKNVRLGFPLAAGVADDAARDDFTIFMPWGTWKDDGKRTYPSQLQNGFKEVLRASQYLEDPQKTTNPFIDAASLNPAIDFFTEPGTHDSVSHAIAAWVDKYKSTETPIIRFLVGDETSDHGGSAGTNPFTEIFWPENNHGRREPLIKHQNAKIYVGHYNPTFKIKSDDSPAIKLITSIVQSATHFIGHFDSKLALEGGELKDIANYLVNNSFRTVSWNHGKILAVNGKVMMTGGGNYWSEYNAKDPNDVSDDSTQRKDHDIVDHQAKFTGDAAVSAHKWADYFWDYLSKIPDTDDKSTWWAANLNDRDGPNWSERGTLPDSARISPAKPWAQGSGGKYTSFTVAKSGNWRGPQFEVNYPAIIFDLARDLVLNLYWQMNSKLPNTFDGLGMRIFGLNKVLGDDWLSRLDIFKDYKINPTAWASRYTKSWAIAYAQSSVVICQQMLVQTLHAGDEEYKRKVQKFNSEHILTAANGQAWDGYIWPFDFFIAIAQAIGAISQSKEKKTDSNFKGVYIILTTKTAGRRENWNDKTSISRIKFRIRRIMKGLPKEAGGIADDKIDAAIRDHLHFRRCLKDDGMMYCHSKIVCVDRRVMYVGSDNVYPCYNEEHGVWVDDANTIQKWLTTFFKPYWERSSEPMNEDEKFDN